MAESERGVCGVTKREFMERFALRLARGGYAALPVCAEDVAGVAERIWNAIESRCLERFPGESAADFEKRQAGE